MMCSGAKSARFDIWSSGACGDQDWLRWLAWPGTHVASVKVVSSQAPDVMSTHPDLLS